MPPLPAPATPLATPPTSIPTAAPAGPLADVPRLLEASRPRAVLRPTGRLLLGIWLAALVGPLLGLNPVALELMALLATAGGVVVLASMAAALRREGAAVDRLEQLVAVRRVPEAVPPLAAVMARPMRAAENRLRAMLLLGGVLSRLDRADDAILVYDELIDAERLGGPGGAMVRLARAAAMLAADRLYDADRAISDLRRLLDRGGAASELRDAQTQADTGGDASADGGIDAGGSGPTPAIAKASPTEFTPAPAATADLTSLAALRLLELHRDVTTNHLAEAVENFAARLPLLRRGLGHRVAEAHALAAIAFHRLGRPEDAAARYADATALAPLSELVRRYADLWPLTQIYPATPPPPQ